jgi:hypothetical protein
VAKGVTMGRKPALTPHQRQEDKRRVKARKEGIGEIARSYDVSRWTISRAGIAMIEGRRYVC